MIRPRFVILLSVMGLLGGCTGDKPDHGAASPHTTTESHATAAGTASPGDSGSTPVLDPADVQGAWWSWAAGAPSGRNPVEDTTGAYCEAGQPRGLWFLAGTFGGSVARRCAVPSGRTLVAPLVNLVGSTKSDCAQFMAAATGNLTIDGVARPSLRWSGTWITATGAEGNPVSESAGPFGGYGCGLWAASPPLPSGTHKVTIRGTSEGLRVSVDYELTVAGS